MTPSEQAILRSPPPAEALRWVEVNVGRGARVTAVRRLRGGVSTTMHALIVSRGKTAQRLVLRRFVRADWLAREPDLAQREATALRLLESSAVPAPRLVAADDDGSASGLPSVLVTMLPGRPVVAPRDMQSWLRHMSDALPTIHALRPPAAEFHWAYAPYNELATLQVPPWSSCPQAWKAVIKASQGAQPTGVEHLIHRDYHPTNILWLRGRISGVVDWVNACRGPAGVDIGHCRRNLALLHGVEVADLFLDYCRDWADYNPYWDLITLTDWLPGGETFDGWRHLGVRLTNEMVRARADAYASSLVARL